MPRRLLVKRSAIHGNGVFAAMDIPAGTPLLPYLGQLRTHADVEAEHGDNHESGHTFLFTLNEDYVIDANQGGNSARWINHSCNPNCIAYSHEHATGNPQRERVIIEALRDIRAGEELSYNYGLTLAVRHTARIKQLWACRCGTANCTGTMLKPKSRRA